MNAAWQKPSQIEISQAEQRPRPNHKKRTRTSFGAERDVAGIPKKRRLSSYAKPRKWNLKTSEGARRTQWEKTRDSTDDVKMASPLEVDSVPDIAHYDTEIYNTYLSQNRSWTRAETDTLFRICGDVRTLAWSVVMERYNQIRPNMRPERTSVELRERFYEVQKLLVRAGVASDSASALAIDFDPESAEKARMREEQYQRRTHEENASFIRLVREHRRTTLDLKREVKVQFIDRAPLIEEHEQFIQARMSSPQTPLPNLPPHTNHINIGYGVVIEDSHNPRNVVPPHDVPVIVRASKDDVYHLTCSEKIVSRETELKGTLRDGKQFVVTFPPPQQSPSAAEMSASTTPKKKKKKSERQNSTTPPFTDTEQISRRISKEVMDRLFKENVIDQRTGNLAVGSREVVEWFQMLRDDMILSRAYKLFGEAKASSSSTTLSN